MNMRAIIKGGLCVLPAGLQRLDIGIENGRIAALADGLDTAGCETLDAAGLWIFPGGVDVHCHLPWPSKQVLSGDDVLSGTRAAICGGVTTVVDFVIPEPGESLGAALERKLDEARQKGLYADYSAHICIREATPANLAEIPALVARGFSSFKVFMAYEGFCLDDADLLRVMESVAAAGGIVSVHAENGLLADRATRALVEQGRVSLEHYPASRPAYCEHEAVYRAIRYAQAAGATLHVHHVSTSEGARLIGAARRRGQLVSGETCPHYLTLTDDAYRAGGLEATLPVIAPPLRAAEDCRALWAALAADDLSAVATDHCPYSRQQKRAGLDDFTKVPGGTAGVETRWPVLFTEGVRAGRLSAGRLATVWAINPARIFGLYPRKAGLSVGADADLILVEPERSSVLSAEKLHMHTDHTLFEGRPVFGFPIRRVLLRGRTVVLDGEPAGEPHGQIAPRGRPLPTLS
jgi:dihydropyrimidinase